MHIRVERFSFTLIKSPLYPFMKKLFGTGVALVTPFDRQNKVDYKGLKNLLALAGEGGTDYLVVNGTTGESVSTTREEKAEILQFVKDNNPKKLPIVYGVGGNHTSQVLQNLEESNLKGVAAILSVSPYYNKPSQAGIIKHYTLIADNSPVPVILYNVPGRTSSNLLAETTLSLAQHPNIIGIKEASGQLEQAMAIAALKPKDFMLISGDDMLTTPMMAIGAIGVISVLANALPEIFKKMTKSALKGEFEKAAQEQFKLLHINPLMYSESNPVGVKQLLKEMGICENTVRLPLIPASKELQSAIRNAYRELQ
jgi:4-hydroxy-tetrahydrodipicolinate synthase